MTDMFLVKVSFHLPSVDAIAREMVERLADIR